jgi:hypothetical protein
LKFHERSSHNIFVTICKKFLQFLKKTPIFLPIFCLKLQYYNKVDNRIKSQKWFQTILPMAMLQYQHLLRLPPPLILRRPRLKNKHTQVAFSCTEKNISPTFSKLIQNKTIEQVKSSYVLLRDLICAHSTLPGGAIMLPF